MFRLLLGLIAALLALALPNPGEAQGPALSTSYITPFPENDTYRLEVWGDALAEGLLTGLTEQLADEPRISVQRRHRPVHSLLRAGFDVDMGEMVSELARSNAHIIVVMIGLNDRYPMRLANGRRVPVGSEIWQQEYGRRVDRMMRAFKAQRMAVYWVGLPIVRRPDVNEELQAISGVIRERAYAAGQKMIDVYAATANQDGRYDPYGPDISGANRLLRQGDGITFTPAGNRKLAHFVERELKRDLVQARAQRAIPLAGSEAEQRLIRPLRPSAAAPAASSAPTAADLLKPAPSAAGRAAAPPAEGGLKADNSRIAVPDAGTSGRRETVTIDLPRPAIPGSLMALLARRTASDRASQPGEVLVREIPGGLTLSRTISMAATPGAPQRRALPSQTPFFRVLVKGERLEPKAGRADDISWPAIGRPAPATPPATPAATQTPGQSAGQLPEAAEPARAPQPIPRPAAR
ncbi:MAG: DUF459 domain-containing protein [Hyphomicrobiaceae bacterium]